MNKKALFISILLLFGMSKEAKPFIIEGFCMFSVLLVGKLFFKLHDCSSKIRKKLDFWIAEKRSEMGSDFSLTDEDIEYIINSYVFTFPFSSKGKPKPISFEGTDIEWMIDQIKKDILFRCCRKKVIRRIISVGVIGVAGFIGIKLLKGFLYYE